MKLRKTRKLDRNLEIVSLRKSGISYREIAEKFGISIWRVRQILEVWEDREID